MKTFKKQIKNNVTNNMCNKVYDKVSKDVYNEAILNLDTSSQLSVFNHIHNEIEKSIHENETSKIRN